MEDRGANEINLMDFPDEILLNIFENLSDTSMIHVARVCHRFKSIAKEAFATLHNGTTKTKYFQLNICNANLIEERRQYEPFFTNFGDSIGGISINFKLLISSGPSGAKLNAKVPKHHWLIGLIQRYCVSITSIIIENGERIDLANIICFTPKLTHLRLKSLMLRNDNWTKNNYPKLIYFSADEVEGINRNCLVTFIKCNRQLEKISFKESLKLVNDIIYDLQDTAIKSLKISDDSLIGGNFTEKTVALNIESLRKLSIMTNKSSFVRFLSTIRGGCKNIEKLSIRNSQDEYEDNNGVMSMQHIDLICRRFDKLETLCLVDFFVSANELKGLVQGIPTLDYLSVECADNFGDTQDDFLTIASFCHELSYINLIKEFNFELPILTYDFCTQFTCRIGQKSNLKLEFSSHPYTITVTRDEVRITEEADDETKSHRIIFWKGYDPALSSTETNFMELDTKLLLDIIGFLDGNAMSAFLQTCKLAERLVKQHLAQNELHLSASPMEETYGNSIATLGEHISRIVMERCVGAAESRKKKMMQDVAKYCGRNLIEIEIRDRIPTDTVICWPNLQKLRLYLTSSINNQTLRLFYCPKLTHLEINSYGKNEIDFEVDWNDSFRSVTSLKFGYYNKFVEKFLYGINQRIGDQLKTLYLEEKNDWFRQNELRSWINLNFIISRFRRLEVLYLNLAGIEKSNYKFIFENCTMLVELAISISAFSNDEEHYDKLFDMFRVIKSNCMKIQIVHLLGDPTSFGSSFLQKFYSMFPKVKVNLH